MKFLVQGIRVVFLVYAGLAILLFLFQRCLLYPVSRASAGELDGAARERGMQPWTDEKGRRVGWFRGSRRGPAKGAALILHGNAGTAVGRDYLVDPLQEALPLDVYLLEYPGYGDRPGTPSQKSLVDAGSEAAALLSGRLPLYLVGESLGTAVACHLAGSLGSKVSGMVLMVPFNRMSDVAAARFPWMPVRWLLLDRFPSADWLASYRGPVAMLLAGSDQVVPPRLGRALFEGYGGPKRLWEIEGAGHEDVLEQPADWWRTVGTFWGLDP